MFCRNCGNEIADNAAVCVKCGVAVGKALNFCPNCGAQTHPDAAVCIKCGIALKPQSSAAYISGSKSKLIAGLTAIFLGYFGIHKFYLGYQKSGIARLILSLVFIFFSCVIGGYFFTNVFGYIGIIGLIIISVLNIVDAVKIFNGNEKDSNGNPLD